MAINPSLQKESTDSPIERANQLNDPQFQNKEGYFPYDLTHQELMTPLFAKATPSLNMATIPGDRIVVNDNAKVILNQIDGNFLSQLNMYNDSFFIPLRCCFPVNYEKLMTNPTKGSDLPNSALPQIPFSLFIHEYLRSSTGYSLIDSESDTEINESLFYFIDSFFDFIHDDSGNRNIDSVESRLLLSFVTSRLTLLATILSRGELLDYLGLNLDISSGISDIRFSNSIFQEKIDNYFNTLWDFYSTSLSVGPVGVFACEPNLSSNHLDLHDFRLRGHFRDKSTFRAIIADCLERGEYFEIQYVSDSVDYDKLVSWAQASKDMVDTILSIFPVYGNVDSYIDDIDSASNPFQESHISIFAPLAYQLTIAQYYTNDSVDNIFNSQLFMQALRAVMYPSQGGFSSEPTFLYNGVTTEYDYISAGGFYYSLINSNIKGTVNRQYVFSTVMFLLRRTLRYGDKFSTSRPNMLAVGDIQIPVENGMVSPIDITQNLLKQRYLNAANYLGSGFLKQFEGIHGVRPSDTDTFPRFVGHRKMALQNQLTNNTSDEQGKQTTNIAGYSSDSFAYDIFVDDYGILIDLISFDVMPVYTSGIDASFHFSDRFDFFNPMLQNIGDEPLLLSELCGDPRLHSQVFGYQMRNSAYKFKLSKAHGALVNDLPSFLFRYPYDTLTEWDANENAKISPEFIRDKPYYLDAVIPQRSGVSPAQYFHFIVAVTNQVQTARLMQAQPPILF